MADQLADGLKFRTLTILDVLPKEALAIEVRQRLSAERLVLASNRITVRRGALRNQVVRFQVT
ncbi:hypothetical protein [Burkholderia cepacia]|uniref:hypothetical protein n=1 Tax=Burkholderia cepacia TaxID=292 RepID=UPI0012D42F5D|nr:hypothetical protein [Burkholderia cepacia]